MKLCGCLSSSPGQFLFLDWSNPPDDKEWELWWQQLWGDDDGDDDIVDDDVDDLKDAIGVLGGGWLSLPLLTGQRRSATIIISVSLIIILSLISIIRRLSSMITLCCMIRRLSSKVVMIIVGLVAMMGVSMLVIKIMTMYFNMTTRQRRSTVVGLVEMN